MKYKVIFIVLSVIYACNLNAQDSTRYYQEAYNEINGMLIGNKPLNFKEAVLATENAYFDGQLNKNKVNEEIELLTGLVKLTNSPELISYDAPDKETVTKHAAIFKVLTDTTSIVLDSAHVYFHKPYTYDFEDMWGQQNWSKMFVSKLLLAGKGNCHSMPYLYKILSEELSIPAYLSFAPNHIYIKLRCKKTGWYNTELTSATFPIDAWIMASGYVHLDAIRNGLYMDTLSLKQSVAYCMLDLAQGYQHKFGKANPDFVLKCCETCLKYNPVNVNTLLTKAEAQKVFLDTKAKEQKVKSPKDLFNDPTIKSMYEDMEQTYAHLYQLGYRRMPEEMYAKWLGLLKTESGKYTNKNVNH